MNAQACVVTAADVDAALRKMKTNAATQSLAPNCGSFLNFLTTRAGTSSDMAIDAVAIAEHVEALLHGDDISKTNAAFEI